MSEYLYGRFSTAQSNRQILLDYLNDHEWATTKECAIYSAGMRGNTRVDKEAALVSKRLHKMIDKGEVEKREVAWSHGKKHIWKALVTVSTDAKAMIESIYGANFEFDEEKPKPKNIAGYIDGKYTHSCGDIPEISKHHSGQGMIGSVSWMRREGSYT